MGFGQPYEYNPIPKRLGVLLLSFAGDGKTRFASQMLQDEKIGVVVDADGRFDEAVSKELAGRFVPLSDNKEDMRDAKAIRDICYKSMPDSSVGTFIVDSVSSIIEPVILDTQRQKEEGKVKNLATAYKQKADLMKYLRDGLVRWGTDVIWIYHLRNSTDANAKKTVVTSIPELELTRLMMDINLKLQIVVDKNERRGVKVLFARGGRTDFVIWDDSGNWEGIRERLLNEVWGGLTEEEQTQLEGAIPTGFKTGQEAKDWAWEYSQNNGGDYKDAQHVLNSYNKVKADLEAKLADTNEKLTSALFFSTWIEHVVNRTKIGETQDDEIDD